MAASNMSVVVRSFRGLANTKDSLKLNSEWLVEADNVYLVDGWPVSRQGTTLLGDANSVYSNRTRSRAFAIRDGDLYELLPASDELQLLMPGVGGGPYQWTSALTRVYLTTGESSWEILPSKVNRWGLPHITSYTVQESVGSLPEGQYRVVAVNALDGRTSGASTVNLVKVSRGGISITDLPTEYPVAVYVSDHDGTLLYLQAVTSSGSVLITSVSPGRHPFEFVNAWPPIVNGGPIVYHESRIYQALYDSEQDFSEVYATKANQFHHFTRAAETTLSELGEVTLLAATARGLLIGTPYHMAIYNAEGSRTEIHLGVPAGNNHDYLMNGDVVVITTDGPRIIGSSGGSLVTDPLKGSFNGDWGQRIGGGIINVQDTELYVAVPLDSNFTWHPPVGEPSPQFFEDQGI